jgi:hypothetical protein
MDGTLQGFKDSGSGEKQLFQIRRALLLIMALFQIYWLNALKIRYRKCT